MSCIYVYCLILPPPFSQELHKKQLFSCINVLVSFLLDIFLLPSYLRGMLYGLG